MTALTEAQAARAELHKSSYWPAAMKQKGSNHLWQTDVHLAATITALTVPPTTRQVGISTGAGTGTPSSLTASALDAYYESVKAVCGQAVRFDCRGLTAQFDLAVKAALVHGLNVLVVFPDDPTLAGPCAAKYVPVGVLDYETGNEPNIHSVTPAQFLSWNNTAYAAIKKVSTDTKVISAGLSPYGAYGAATGGDVNPVTYLEQTLNQGKLLFDQFGWHPYNFWQDALGPQMLAYEIWSAWSQMAATPVSALSLLKAHGLPEKIAVTEFGAPTYSGAVTQQAQADLITLGVPDLKGRSYIGDIYLYSLRDRPELSPDQAHFGIEGKPAAAAFAAS